MTLDRKLVDKAVARLRSRGLRDPSDRKGAAEILADYDDFDDVDDLDVLVAAALAELRGGSGPMPERTGRSGGQSRRGGPSRRLPESARAPFRFVTLPDEVALPETRGPIDLPLADGYCAEIAYELEAETPLLIGGDTEREGRDKGAVLPMRLGASGDHVIPGATVRGMVRSLVEIVAHGRLGSANLHHRFGLRDFEHPYYEEVAKVGHVHAGWLTGEVDATGRVTAMQIEPCDWAHVLIDRMAESPELKGKVSGRQTWIGRSLVDKYAAVGMQARSGRHPILDFTRTFGFGPPSEDRGRPVRAPQKGGTPGVLVFASKLPGRDGNKKYEYAFFDRPGAVPVPISPRLIDDFVRLNSKPSKNRPQPDGSWRELEPTFSEGSRIPVFYVGDPATSGRDFFFGLTRMLKLPHRRSVRDVLAAQARHPGQAAMRKLSDGREAIDSYEADFVENLFGYVVEPKDLMDDPGTTSPGGVARKGRVAFSFAHLTGSAAAEVADAIEVVQSAPRASFSPFYLKPAHPGRTGAEPDYSAEQAPRLAGRKRYLPRDARPDVAARRRKIAAMGQRQLDAIRRGPGGREASADVRSKLRFLVPADGRGALVFSGTIRLHNVTAAELGAVLFALTHGGDPQKPYRHMLGRAKPFGAGQMRLRSLRLTAEANMGTAVAAPQEDEMLSADTRTGFCPRDGAAASLKPFLKAFGDFMRKQPGLRDFPKVPAVKELLAVSDPQIGAELEDELDYMPLDDFNPIRRAVKPLKDAGAAAPASPGKGDGRLLGAPPPKREPIFWT